MNAMDLFSPDESTESHTPSVVYPRYARVAIERGIDRMDGLTYGASEGVRVGQHVTVPVGRGNTPTAGYVIEVGGEELPMGTIRRR